MVLNSKVGRNWIPTVCIERKTNRMSEELIGERWGEKGRKGERKVGEENEGERERERH